MSEGVLLGSERRRDGCPVDMRKVAILDDREEEVPISSLVPSGRHFLVRSSNKCIELTDDCCKIDCCEYPHFAR